MASTILKASLDRVLARRVRLAVMDSVVAAGPMVLAWYWRWRLGSLYGVPWLQTGVGLGVLALLASFFFKNRSIPEITIDTDGLTYRHRGDVERIPWPEYRGHRLTWGIPRQVRIVRALGDSILIDLPLFEEEQREAIMRELTLRSGVALPNQRLEPTRRMIKE